MTHKLTREILDQIKILEAMGVKVEISNECVVTSENEEVTLNQDVLAFRIEFFGFTTISDWTPDILKDGREGARFFTTHLLFQVMELMDENSLEILSHIHRRQLSKIAGLEEPPTPPQPIM